MHFLEKKNYLRFEFMKEKIKNKIENQTFMSVLLSKSRKSIRTRRILYNHVLFGIIKMLLHECLGNLVKDLLPQKNHYFLGGNLHISLTIM